jgi:nicotinate-nucleotide pyrophosphorylase (carboxylating)
MDWKSRRVTTLLEAALLEDKAANDITTALTVDPALRATATIIAKQPCVVAGIGCISAFLTLFARMSSRPVGRFEVILNLMQRMSGIATLTNEYVRAVAAAKSKTRILDTRKTIPGLRAMDKYAVCCGGGLNHRLDLQDGILIKNNHISLGGGLPAVLAKALEGRKPGQMVQVEARTAVELQQAIAGGADSILLDNMTPKEVAAAIKLIRKSLPTCVVEASGNMNLKTVTDYARTGVDFISVGALTHSATAVDLSMRITADLT